jgi:hypothetical protein
VSDRKVGQKRDEQNRIFTILAESEKKHRDKPVIIIKETSITHLSGKALHKKIENALRLMVSSSEKDGWDDRYGWDIFYLCRWLDRYDLYDRGSNLLMSGEREIKGGRAGREERGGDQALEIQYPEIVRSWSPHGLQAFVVSPRGREKLLRRGHIDISMDRYINEEIEEGRLKAVCYRDNLFNYDMNQIVGSKYGVVIPSDKDLAKMSQYRRPPVESHDKISPVLYTIIVICAIGILSAIAAFRNLYLHQRR